jgi:hypothetical protein
VAMEIFELSEICPIMRQIGLFFWLRFEWFFLGHFQTTNLIRWQNYIPIWWIKVIMKCQESIYFQIKFSIRYYIYQYFVNYFIFSNAPMTHIYLCTYLLGM